MSREVPFDENKKCGDCGTLGAFDFMGDFLCGDCFHKYQEEDRKIKESKCDCGKPIEWQNAPCDNDDHEKCTSHYGWCDECVPRNCIDCNQNTPKGQQWRPCIEISRVSV